MVLLRLPPLRCFNGGFGDLSTPAKAVEHFRTWYDAEGHVSSSDSVVVDGAVDGLGHRVHPAVGRLAQPAQQLVPRRARVCAQWRLRQKGDMATRAVLGQLSWAAAAGWGPASCAPATCRSASTT